MLSKSIPTKFDQGDLDRLNYFATLYDRPVSYLIREATRTYLNAQAKKLEFLEDAKTAAQHYRSTGIHCNHTEMQTWLKDLAQGRVSEKPECHK